LPDAASLTALRAVPALRRSESILLARLVNWGRRSGQTRTGRGHWGRQGQRVDDGSWPNSVTNYSSKMPQRGPGRPGRHLGANRV